MAGTSQRSRAALCKKDRKEKGGGVGRGVSPCVFVCVIRFPMTEECAASSTYQHVSPSSGERTDVFLRSLSAELLCDCSSPHPSALIPVFFSAALGTTSYGLQTTPASVCTEAETREHWRTVHVD